MATLNQLRPYGQVYGRGGVAFEQDGKFFNALGEEIHLGFISPPEEAPAPESDPNVVPKMYEAESPPADKVHEERSIEGMHWRHLKVLVESCGGKWTNRQDALVFLKGIQ